MQLCGRFRLDFDKVWSLTPSEFEELVAGGLEREREERVGVAMIIQTIHAACGTKTTIRHILGEDEPDDVDSASPLALDAKQVMNENRKRALAKKHAKWAEGWLPRGLVHDPYAPPERWLPEGIEVPRRGDP